MGIFRALASVNDTMTISEIAQTAKLPDAGLVQRVVQSMAAHGMVDQIDATHYSPNAITHDFTNPGRIGSAMTQMFCMRAYSALPWFLRENGYKTPSGAKNGVWQHAYGGEDTMWEWMKKNPQMGKYFNDYMTAARPYTTSSGLVDEFPFGKLFEGSTAEEVIFVDV